MGPGEAAAALDVVLKGLTPDQLKRAYLLQVRQHRPERDPEGFQRVRQAFEVLERWLANQVWDEDDEDDEDDEAYSEDEDKGGEDKGGEDKGGEDKGGEDKGGEDPREPREPLEFPREPRPLRPPRDHHPPRLSASGQPREHLPFLLDATFQAWADQDPERATQQLAALEAELVEHGELCVSPRLLILARELGRIEAEAYPLSLLARRALGSAEAPAALERFSQDHPLGAVELADQLRWRAPILSGWVDRILRHESSDDAPLPSQFRDPPWWQRRVWQWAAVVSLLAILRTCSH